MAVHKLHIDEFDEIDYELIAIHTSLEDYRLAYFLNQQLPVLFCRNKIGIQISNKQGNTSFSRYIFEDQENDSYWNLIQNRNVISRSDETSKSLFPDARFASNVYLLPEFKTVDYFLKVENGNSTADDIEKKIQVIPQISTVYTVNISKIKSKNNLIF